MPCPALNSTLCTTARHSTSKLAQAQRDDPELPSSTSEQRMFTATSQLHLVHFSPQTLALITCILTSWDHCRHPTVFGIFLRLAIDLLVGRLRFPFPKCRLKPSLTLSLRTGFRSASRPLSLPTTVPNSNLRYFPILTSRLVTHRSRTTAYHPSSNGMVERFHRQLQNSLKASPDATKWTEHLPIILLGIRNTVKVDLNCTPAQLVYGTPLRLPGQFFSSSSTTPDLAPSSYADHLQLAMLTLKPVSPRQQSIVSNVPKDLNTCTHVYVRTDAVRKPL